jgi:uncharacterized membrane protein YraQ (UPF0718 family)
MLDIINAIFVFVIILGFIIWLLIALCAEGSFICAFIISAIILFIFKYKK